MKRFKTVALVVVGMIAAGLAIDYAAVRHKEQRLSAAVSECGGQIGSIPAWPIGTEYRITLHQVPDEKQLHQLEIANLMRGRVGIAFRDCEVSNDDRAQMSAVLPNCHFIIDP